jgi:hypothetical protein
MEWNGMNINYGNEWNGISINNENGRNEKE